MHRISDGTGQGTGRRIPQAAAACPCGCTAWGLLQIFGGIQSAGSKDSARYEAVGPVLQIFKVYVRFTARCSLLCTLKQIEKEAAFAFNT